MQSGPGAWVWGLGFGAWVWCGGLLPPPPCNSPNSPPPKRSEVPIRIPSIPHLLPSWGGGGGSLCVNSQKEFQGVAVKFRLLRGPIPPPSSPLPPPPPPPPPTAHTRQNHTYIYIYIYIYLFLYLFVYLFIYLLIYLLIYLFIYLVIYSLSMHKPYHSSPRRRCTPISCESKSPRPGIMSSSQHTAGPRRTTRSV